MTLSEFEEALQLAQTTHQLNEALEKFLSDFKIDTFAFTFYSYYPTSLHKAKFHFSSSNLMPWHKHFIEEGYDDIDSTLDVVYQTTLPIKWDVKQQLKAAKSFREKRMRQDSIQYGIEKGVSIPIHGPNEDFAILVLMQMRNQICLENFSEYQQELFTAAHYFFSYLQKKIIENIPENTKFNINHREMQCLVLIAKQYSNEEIAKILNITERTVNYHIQRLNKKLGASNKYQSVIKALLKNLIQL